MLRSRSPAINAGDDERRNRFTMAELCTRYGVSRRVGLEETNDGACHRFLNTVLPATSDEKGRIIRG